MCKRELAASRGLSPAELDALNVHEFNETDSDKVCAVCLEPLRGAVVTLPWCLHKYHSECVKPWLARTAKCPECRGDVRERRRLREQ